MSKNYGIILASGTGERLDCHIPKQFIQCSGKTIVEHTLEVFEKNSNIDEIIIVVHPLYTDLMNKIVSKNG